MLMVSYIVNIRALHRSSLSTILKNIYIFNVTFPLIFSQHMLMLAQSQTFVLDTYARLNIHSA